jgi:LPS-assembly lipoprotein
MSSPEAARRPVHRLAAAAAGLLWLAGCGFQPMYAQQAEPGSGQVAPAALNSVAIAPLPDRLGQQLHNALRDRLNPRGQPRDPAYRLQVSLQSRTEPMTLRSDGTTTRRSFTLSANWQLVSTADRALSFTSTARSETAFNVVDQPYATVAALRDAEERAVDQVAATIAARVSAALAGGQLRRRDTAAR